MQHSTHICFPLPQTKKLKSYASLYHLWAPMQEHKWRPMYHMLKYLKGMNQVNKLLNKISCISLH